jgi:D-amino-acid dehydrogenase
MGMGPVRTDTGSARRGRAVVVGGGVIGVCVAYFLQRDGWQVTLLERGPIGEGCSFGNAGLVVPSHIIPLAAPGVWRKGLGWLMHRDSPFRIRPRLDWALGSWLFRFWRSCSPAHVQRSLPTLRELTYGSLRLFDELARLPGLDFGYSRTGMLTVYRTEAGYEEALAEARLLREFGVAIRTLGGGETEALEPCLRAGVVGGVLFEDDASLLPDVFVKGLAAEACRQGALVLTGTEVTGFEREGDRVSAVVTAAGRHAADEVVLAAGSTTPVLGRHLGIHMPIEAGKGYSMTFSAGIPGHRLPLILGEAKVSVTPMAGRVRFSGTLDLCGDDATVDRYRAASILRSAAEWLKAVPALGGTPVWSGLRPCTPDGLPLLGRPKGHRNVIVAAGHAMVGVSLGPITGALVADLAARRPTPVPLAPLDPDRFSRAAA